MIDKNNSLLDIDREKMYRFRLKACLHVFIDNPDSGISETQAKSIVNLLGSGERLTQGEVNYSLNFIPLQQLLLYTSEKLK